MTYDRTRLKARFFDRDRRRRFGANAKLLLLKTDGGAARFAELARLTDSWSADFSEFFGATTFRVAKTDAAFNAKASDATHVLVIDADDEALNKQLHSVNRETSVPAGADHYWRIRATSTGKRYTPPTP